MTPRFRKLIFETLYKNQYLYRFASTVPFAGQWRIWQQLALPRIVGHDVLEIGCGLGDLLADMLTAGYHCYAVEQSPQMVVAARDTVKRLGLGTRATVLQGSAQHVPFSDGSFDTVVSTFPSEYIYESDTIAEVERVLRPGGRLIVVEGANLLPVGFFQPFLVLLQMLVYGPSLLHKKGGDAKSEKSDGEGQPDHNKAEKILYTGRDTSSGVTTQVISNADFGQRIPLEQHGLRRRSELVRSRRWEVYITIGEKAE